MPPSPSTARLQEADCFCSVPLLVYCKHPLALEFLGLWDWGEYRDRRAGLGLRIRRAPYPGGCLLPCVVPPQSNPPCQIPAKVGLGKPWEPRYSLKKKAKEFQGDGVVAHAPTSAQEFTPVLGL